MANPLLKTCEALWNHIIKERAGYRSELSGVKGKVMGGNVALAAHHIAGKSNYRLRFELKNGICIENKNEHIFGVHSRDPIKSKEYQDWIIDYIGKERWDFLKTLKHRQKKADLNLIKIYLEQELRLLKGPELIRIPKPVYAFVIFLL